MTTLNGIHDAEYLVQFLGKKIAVQDEQDKNKYYLYPRLHSITDDGIGCVVDSDGNTECFSFDQFENPYIVLLDTEIIIK